MHLFPSHDHVGDTFAYVAPAAAAGIDSISSSPIADFIVYRGEVYGGATQAALETNAFIPASPPVQIAASNTFKVFGGDTFVSMFTQQWCNAVLDTVYFPNTGNDKYGQNLTTTFVYPTETSINIALAYGATLKTGVQKDWGPAPNTRTEFRQEEGNLSSSGGAVTVAKVNDMYKAAYNSAYSIDQTRSGLGFFIKPDNISSVDSVNDIRGYLSDVKINGEVLDSWTIFRSNNYYDVEADHGPINKIINWRDDVYFIQDTAVGAYSINPRAVTTTSDGIPTELGSGEGFAHHQYISTEHGSTHQWAVQTTDTGIYYFDATHKKIFRIGEGNAPLSEMKGMHSFLSKMNGNVLLRKDNGGDNPINGKGVNVVRDMLNDEVLFSFHGLYSTKLIFGLPRTYYLGEIAITVPP